MRKPPILVTVAAVLALFSLAAAVAVASTGPDDAANRGLGMFVAVLLVAGPAPVGVLLSGVALLRGERWRWLAWAVLAVDTAVCLAVAALAAAVATSSM
jgi:hypothetical protein